MRRLNYRIDFTEIGD